MLNASEIVKEIQKRYKIIGRTEELEKINLARLVDKNIIIEGEVGVGKTRIAKAIASFYDTEFARIDCSEETLPNNLVGYFDPPLVISKGYSEESYIYGPLASSMLKGGCLFINEINRMPESTQNSLLTALDERILTSESRSPGGNGFNTQLLSCAAFAAQSPVSPLVRSS